MKYVYEAIVEPEDGYLEVRFPDFDIVTQGVDIADAALMAQDLLENHVVIALRKEKPLPTPTFGNACPEHGFRMVVAIECDKDTPQEGTMSVTEAAGVLDVSPARVRAMIRDGILRSRKVGRVHLVDAESVMQRFNEPVSAGRPKRKTTVCQAR